MMKDVTEVVTKETEEEIKRLDDFEPVEVSFKQIMDSYNESREEAITY